MTYAHPIPTEGLVLGRALVPETTDDRISRVHARIDRQGDRLVVTDAGSRNGTFVNGHPPESAGTEVMPGAVIRTGRTLWAVVADVALVEIDRRVRAIFDAVQAAAPGSEISVGFLEVCLLSPPRTRTLVEAVVDAATRRAQLGGELVAEDLEVEARAGVYAVFPGIASAIGAAHRIAAKLAGATTRSLVGGNSLVEASRGERRVAITCPPSTAFLVEIHDGAALVASGYTLKDAEAIAVASAWLDGAPPADAPQFMRLADR